MVTLSIAIEEAPKRKDSIVKRAAIALTATALCASSVVLTPSASMAATPTYGSVQIKYSVAATAQLSIGTNYNTTTGATGSGAGATTATILQSPAAGGGACAAGASESTAATLTFGTITPPTSGYVGCYYKNAINVGLLSNDSTNGVKLVEYVDAVPTGTQICAYFTDTTLKATPTASAPGANPAAYTTSCQSNGGGTPVTGVALTGLGATTGGAAPGAAGDPTTTTPAGPAQNVNATPIYTAYTAGGATICTCTGASGTQFKFLGQDIQFNVSGAASVSATTQTVTITVAAIPQ